ncbi:MAG: UMP kinase [Candidatus Puniceispirillum sp.]|nr:UMP kinase [Candidatus Pelagibacter sp.]MBA4283355.1 UMP kinase [Candidatus Puniceispirillum sp.]
MAKNNYKRVLLKISGEALSSLKGDDSQSQGLCKEMLEKIAQDICQVHDWGVQIAIVIGGGNFFRGVKGVTDHRLDRAVSDQIGMLATVMNGLALRSAIEDEGVPCRLMTSVPMSSVSEFFVREKAIRHLEKNRVVIFAAGTGNPFFTTDTCAALRAAETKCQLMLKATMVNGLYDDDPKSNPNAQFIPYTNYSEVIEKGYKVMDATALTLARENNLPLRIFSIYPQNSFADVIKSVGHFTHIDV